MAKNTIADLDVTAANNTDFLNTSTAGTADANTIDTMLQNLAGITARFYGDIGGLGTVGGTADVITLTSLSTYQTLEPALMLSFKAAAANTGAATLNLDGLGAKAIRRQGDSALVANDILANGRYIVQYDADYNAAAGAWVLLNPTVSSSISAASTTEALTGTDTAKYLTADALAALWEKGSDIASASTISIGEGGYFHVTGTTTITDIDFATAKNGRGAWLVFDGALTLTYHATTLTMPGAASITTAAGDAAYVVQDASDNAKVLFYMRADGTAIVSSSAGQPVPTTSTLAVGSAVYLLNDGSSIANGATAAGSTLYLPSFSAGGVPTKHGVQTGTWKNITGATSVVGEVAYFVRTA